MLDDLPLITPKPSATAPFAGKTVLLVEDSRYASEAMRLMSLKSGARVRRADCLFSARRHLRVYRPTIVLVDLGLPDGSGEELIAELAVATPRVPVIIGLSGDPDCEAAARAAGADGFLAKPIDNLGAFQQTLLEALPEAERPKGPREMSDASVEPDRANLMEDLLKALERLEELRDGGNPAFLTHFLNGLALSAHDQDLAAAVSALRAGHIAKAETLLRKRAGVG